MSHPSPTARLRFREMELSDLDDFSRLLGDPEVMAFYPRPKTRVEARAWIDWNQGLYAEHGFGLWAIERQEDGAFVGDCGLTPQAIDDRIEIEVGYHVRRELQGRGYASEAARACRDYATAVLRTNRLIAIIDPSNRPSQRVAEKIGLAYERRTIDRTGRPVVIYAADLAL